MILLDNIDPKTPILIAGPTASGKSALAANLARHGGGRIVNADAMQVYASWRVLTARPTEQDEADLPHALYGHVPFGADYSVGDWLRAVSQILKSGERPIIVGGTGLYFRALTEGLADIPAIAADIRRQAVERSASDILADLQRDDPAILERIDPKNPARLRRAWEVLESTGRALSEWQDDAAPALLPLNETEAILLDADRDWLGARIARRFDAMLANGALEEARENLPQWHRAGGAAKAIGGPELIAHLNGEMTLTAARDAAIIATRQYAKRQRTWFRARMADWRHMTLPEANSTH